MQMEQRKILIVGGGNAGLSVAARLRRAGQANVAVIEPSPWHHYQPLWTLVGGGCASQAEGRRPTARVMPAGVRWIQERAASIDPERCCVILGSGESIAYDYLVLCPGVDLHWERTPGLRDTLGQGGVSSNYEYDLAPRTWEFLKDLRQGTALFSMPSGPVKCPGAPQKIAYLAAHWWQQQGVLDDIHIILALPGAKLFGVPEFTGVLERVVARYGIDLRLEHELVEVDSTTKQALLIDRRDGGAQEVRVSYDVLHATPAQAAPEWIRSSALAGAHTGGFIELDKHTLQHPRWSNIFALGDAAGTPNPKTGAAVRKQAPVVVRNLLSVMAGAEAHARYDGYTSCPFTTARNQVLLAEFDYSMKPCPSLPLIDVQQERRDMWFLKRHGLPFLYWNFILRGLL